MKIFTFDTALNKTYIALSEDSKIIEKITIENTQDKYHSAFLIKEIANILKNNNFTMQDIDALGINIGPGSFTGIRACTTVGRVIAQQIDAPLVSVSSLEILARINPDKGKTLVTLDARKGSAYVGIYSKKNEIEAPKILKVEDMINLAKNDVDFVICDSPMAVKLIENNVNVINYENDDYPLNEYLAKIVFEKLKKDEKSQFNWAKVKPLYIQPPSIFGK